MANRACVTAADCVAVLHVTNCCGGQAWLGIRQSEQSRFSTLESACRQTYPPCGCFDGRVSADDGSQIPINTTPPVTCTAGMCRTYATACGQPCATGTSCMTCTSGVGAMTSSCVAQCPTAP